MATAEAGLAEQVGAIRHSVAISRGDHVRYLRLSGGGAYEALDRLCPAALRLRDGQMLHTLLLDEDARCRADLYVGWDDQEFFLLAEGMSDVELGTHLSRYLPPDGSVRVDDHSTSHGILSLDGPYAWELLGLVVDPEAIGLPYLTFYNLDRSSRWTCYRGGKTGEYGYGIIAPRDELDELERRLREVGAGLDVGSAGLDALDQCALENGFFNIRREGREPVTPIELQLQWRVSYQKDFVGSAALRRRRSEGARVRLTCLTAPGALAAGDGVSLEGAALGRVVNAGFSSERGDWVALALLDVAWAHPGLELAVRGVDGPVAARSVSPPVLNNRSLVVSPQLHSYGTRHQYPAPPLARR